MDYWLAILGGLIGSIVTVVVTKLLEIFQASKSHKYELDRIFFEKKLAAAELAMTQYTILSNSLINLAVLFERANNESNPIEDYLQTHLHQQATQQIELANNASFIISNSIALYFDIKSQFNQNEVISDFLALLASLQPLLENRYSTFEFYKSKVGTTNENSSYQLYLQAEQSLDEKLKAVSLSMNRFNQELLNTMKQIREEMSRFDY